MTMIYAILMYLVILGLNLRHPVMLSLNLIIMSGLVGAILLERLTSWLTMSLLLVFLGGMMVIFLYFSSLVSSEKFPKMRTRFEVLLLAFMILELGEEGYLKSSACSMWANYALDNTAVNVVLITYLLSALFSVVKLSQHFKGMLETQCF